jgi:hypothetical protein
LTKYVVQGRAKTVHGGNDGERDACCNQAVFDRGHTGLVVPEFEKNAFMFSIEPRSTPRVSSNPSNNGSRTKLGPAKDETHKFSHRTV